jgi:retron-type reverse transcriptase
MELARHVMLGFLKRLFGLEGGSKPAAPAGPKVRKRGRSLGPEVLLQRLGVPLAELQSLQPSYRSFQIPKRDGGRRTILAPDERLKALQRQILRRLLGGLKSHPAATGFERGHSIVTNALPHVGKDVVVRMDLKDFFGSISASRVAEYFMAVGWSADAAQLLTRLVTHQNALPQGAPTSPRLSNLVNYRLDVRLDALAQRVNVSYSRYADDITFSAVLNERAPASRANGKTPARINNVIHAAKRIIADEGYTVHIHKKLRITRRHNRQLVTGLVVNRKANLPRTTRRLLRAVEHHLSTGRPATLTPKQMAGWRALQSMIAQQSAAD